MTTTSSDPINTFRVDQLNVRIYANQDDLSNAVAAEVREYLVATLNEQETAAAIMATGNSQIRFLESLVAMGGVDWSRITLFHMDEYLGLSDEHPASFRRYMRERVEAKARPRAFHFIEGDALLPLDECQRYADLLRAQPIDLCCLGVGENGHLAFNDPPVANLDDPHLVKIVKLDDGCKRQQVNEGHFPGMDAVPPYAITLTIPALRMAKKMMCLAPETRKANAVKQALQGPIGTECPASALRRCPQATMLLDSNSAAGLTQF